MRIIPNKAEATVTLNPGLASEETVTIYNAWMKPIDGGLQEYGHLNLQGDETLIKIPDHELNPANNGREIRSKDRIVMGGVTYFVTASGSKLKTVQTVWECVCRKILPSA